MEQESGCGRRPTGGGARVNKDDSVNKDDRAKVGFAAPLGFSPEGTSFDYVIWPIAR